MKDVWKMNWRLQKCRRDWLACIRISGPSTGRTVAAISLSARGAAHRRQYGDRNPENDDKQAPGRRVAAVQEPATVLYSMVDSYGPKRQAAHCIGPTERTGTLGYVILRKAEDVKFGDIQLPETITEFSAGGENGLFTLKPVLRHRVTVNFKAEADGVAADMVLDDLIARVQHTIFMA